MHPLNELSQFFDKASKTLRIKRRYIFVKLKIVLIFGEMDNLKWKLLKMNKEIKYEFKN